VLYGPRAHEADLEKLAEWNANLIRWHFYWHDAHSPQKRRDLAVYDAWLQETIAEVDRVLPLCRKLGIRIVIDLHTPPGGGDPGQMTLFSDAVFQRKFVEVWDLLAAHYKDEPAVWGYDLLNEPVEGSVAPGLLDWRALAEKVARRIREIDARHAIIVEPGSAGGWDNLPFFEPLDIPGVIYSVHMYEPLPFTHQGILAGMPSGVTYPGTIDGRYWDKRTLRRELEPVRQYQRDYNVPIYIGEFSAPRWAPNDSAAAWLRDCIELFEEYGWDWSYHSFREWHAWNVELGSDPEDREISPVPTSRQRVLESGFKRNAKPHFHTP
jgi:aryl-phospho-beta-D-glucosidase BglC (GH1 family)